MNRRSLLSEVNALPTVSQPLTYGKGTNNQQRLKWENASIKLLNSLKCKHHMIIVVALEVIVVKYSITFLYIF